VNVVLLTLSSQAGAADFVARLANAVARARPGTALVCPSDFEKASELEGVRVLPFDIADTSAMGRARKTAAFATQMSAARKALASETAPGIVHVNFPGWGPLVARDLRELRARGSRILFEVHDVVPHYWRLPRAARALEASWYRASYRAADAVVVHTRASRDLIRSWAGVTAPVFVIPLGEYSMRPEPLPPRALGGERVVLLLGRLRENKGVHLAVRAVQRLRREGAALRLHVAGTPYASEASYWERCKAEIARAPEGIDVTERFLSEDEVVDALRRADATLLPYAAEFHSASGVASLSLSNGRPLIATDSASVDDEQLGVRSRIRIDEASEDGVVRALRAFVATDPAELAATAAQDAAVVRRALSWENLANDYAEVYAALSPAVREVERR
jgi:glycosyltransferase involved in cell wall biosynthesis